VEIRAVGLRATVAVEAGLDLEKFWVELLLLPAMTVLAFVLLWTSILVRRYKVLGGPAIAHFFRIGKDGWFPSVVLPIVCIDTDISFVVILLVWAPHSLEMEDIEIHVWFELLNQFHR
jgi:hypothetical protein